MNQTSISGDIIEVFMRQLGATKVKMVSSELYCIQFELDSGRKVSYTYNVNYKDQYFLQRIKPYPLSHGAFRTAEELIDFITRDFRRFQNADKSHNFPLFLEIAERLDHIKSQAEIMFLTCNVNPDDMSILDKDLENVLNQIERLEKTSKKL